MHNLKPLTPLGADLVQVDKIGTLEIHEVVDQAMASVAARKGQEVGLKKKVASAFGLSLPDIGQSASGENVSSFWMGPEQWMIAAPYQDHEDLAGEVKKAIGQSASVVEQTDGWCRFEVEGKKACDVFERLCNVPVRTMNEGAVIRSSVEHVGAFVWCLTEKQRYAVIGPRSSAKSLHHGLITAAHSVS